jgi:hypothetical protein
MEQSLGGVDEADWAGSSVLLGHLALYMFTDNEECATNFGGLYLKSQTNLVLGIFSQDLFFIQEYVQD